jgi:tetratricopeptide (TPR) repeat protein
LGQYAGPEVVATSLRALTDPDPQVRAAAVANLEDLPRRQLLDHLAPLLDDPRRVVRIQAARVLAHLPNAALTPAQQQAREQALADLERGLLADADQAGAHLSLGTLAERRSQLDDAEQAYRRAILVQPGVSGPRTNLAALLEARGQADEAAQLRRGELRLLERDVRLLPSSAALQYRYGLALYLQDRQAEALAALEEACRLEPRVPDFRLALTLLYQKQQRWPEALNSAEQLSALRPDDPTYRQLREEIRQQGGGGAASP